MADTDMWRSRKTAGDLRDTAHADKTIRSFKARVLVHQREKVERVEEASKTKHRPDEDQA